MLIGQAKLIEPRRLYQQIAEQIRNLIHSGEFKRGARLPAERELAQRLGVSRPSLREALIALEIDNSVEIRMGASIYVTAGELPAPHRIASLGNSPSELMKARIVIEGSVAQLSAGRIGSEALLAIEAILQAMEHEIVQGRKPMGGDREFYLAIAAQCGNTVLIQIVAGLFDERHSPISAKMQQHFGTAEAWRCALQEHCAIFDALGAGDDLLAQSHMQIHLELSRRRWIESDDLDSVNPAND